MTRAIPFGKEASCLLAVVLLAVADCTMASDGHDVTFAGDATFNLPHGNQAIQVALYDVAAGEVVATDSGSVSPDETPAFSFTFSGALEEGKLYDLHYWIDSNFGGGNEDRCDPVNIDHQWRLALTDITEPVSFEVSHDPAEQAPVCTSFE